jgi:hypothetical protein
MDVTVCRVIGEASKDDISKSNKGKPTPFPSCFFGGGGACKNFTGFVPRNVLDKALAKPKPKPKRVAENFHIPVTFSDERPTWIQCKKGKVGVKWTGRDWLVVGTGLGTEHCDERDLRYIVRNFCGQLDGAGRYFFEH